MVEWHGGIRLITCKKILSLVHQLTEELYSEKERKKNIKSFELKEKFEEKYGTINSCIFYNHMRFLRSCNLINSNNNLTIDGIIFRLYSNLNDSEKIMDNEKFMFFDTLYYSDRIFQKITHLIFLEFLNREKITSGELKWKIYEIKKEESRRKKKLFDKLEKYEEEYKNMTPNERINSKFYNKLRHFAGGIIEIIEQLDILSRVKKGSYLLHSYFQKNTFDDLNNEDRFQEFLMRFYLPRNRSASRYEVKNKILESLSDLNKFLPIGFEVFQKAVKYKCLKDGLIALPSEINRCINELIFSQEIYFRLNRNKIFINGYRV